MSSARAESSAGADRGLKSPAVEFDAFASSYNEHLNHSVRISGDTSDYFAAYKAAYIARKIAPNCGKPLLWKALRNYQRKDGNVDKSAPAEFLCRRGPLWYLLFPVITHIDRVIRSIEHFASPLST